MSEPQPQAQPAAPFPRRRGVAGIVEDGVLAGIVGAAIVAVWFLVLDIARGQPFLTPSLLGSVLFLGATVEEASDLNVVMVFAYTGLHGLAFLATGAVIAWMVSQFEENPQFGLVLLLLFLLFQSVVFGLEVTIVPNLVGALGAVSVALANLLSAVAMFWFLLVRRPEALANLRESWEEE